MNYPPNRIEKRNLWPTKVLLLELDVPAGYNEALIAEVLAGCARVKGQGNELRLHDLHEVDHEAITWLMQEIRHACAFYCDMDTADGINVGLRGVQINRGSHISTHTEARESDLGVAYWPSGSIGKIGSEFSDNGDGINEPTFIVEDPSRSFSDLRLPFEDRHSICIRPRPGMLAVFPAHLPHNMHPYMGDIPFIHIVAQIQMPWTKEYHRRFE
jgi:hypothetical protein